MSTISTTRNRLSTNAIILIRIMVGSIFLSEGIQKFLFPEALGVGRFTAIGIPSPDIIAPFVGIVEIVCGTCLLLGFITRLAAVPLLINILVAIASTKIPMYLKSGFWKTVHEARVDWSMLLGLLFILIAGSGGWSLDKLKESKKSDQPESQRTH